ncbi:MAG: 5-(carboxyamino)imidazole ribonucleotide synthase [Rhizobiaceae bacterium]|nr:5-(carboxyamino)imidazole ribonucleotide synthase [Rhizobiaceae bacterium]MCV0407581.1 5-(carboxyamino)imidazole ribonucleotide synthase [Rhizobiaceae bacterium]
MTEPLSPGSTIGIIGGGQLGRMLAMAAARLSYHTLVLEPQAHCPAHQVADRQIAADYDNPSALEELAAECAVVTYEFENVPVAAAEALAQKVSVFPPPAALAVSQDRLAEKTFLNDAGIATAPFRAVATADELKAALAEFGGQGVLKTRRFGYDGKGQHVFRGPEAVETVFDAMGTDELILEGLVGFEREISVIGVRGRDGSIALYDPAENVHRDGILRTSTVPVATPAATIEAAGAATRRLLERLDYVGIVGVEFFVLPDGSVIANEFAPRVHNSGHWTEAACAVSQFEQHIRAICGLPLGDTRRHSDCVMENLIGDDVDQASVILREVDAVLHLYGKTETRPGRKMGHVTRLKQRELPRRG